MHDRQQVCSYLRAMKDILDNGSKVIRFSGNVNFNLTLANSMNDLFISKIDGMRRIEWGIRAEPGSFSTDVRRGTRIDNPFD